MSELTVKIERIQGLLETQGLDALALRRESSFAWATCGAASHVNLADGFGAASVLYTPQGRYIVTNNIEAPRLREEEGLEDQGWEVREAPWHEQVEALAELTRGMRVGADHSRTDAVNLELEVARVRAALTPEEGERFRLLGKACAEAMDAAILAIRPGLTEQQIAGMLAREAWGRGVEPIVNLVGTDERIFHYRHPLPTPKRLEHYAMLILCGRKRGLVASITRAVYFGSLPEELRVKSRAVAQVDAHLIASTRPGARICDIFHEGASCYELYGHPDEWKLHHQGGLAGYEPREIIATPGTEDDVRIGQVYAWNPSITGTKSEDTVLVGETQNEILTVIPRWPSVKVTLRGQTFERPLIMEIM